jgi:hypothetical protein
LIGVIGQYQLECIPRILFWVALAAWTLTLLGMLHRVAKSLL